MRLPRLITTATVLAALSSSAALHAQTSVFVVLKIRSAPGSLGAPDANSRVTLTLASGEKVTVPLTDIDIEQTKTLSGVRGNTSSSSGPSMQELLLSPSMAEATLQAKCQEEWNTDFQMRAFCEGQQKEALASLRRRGTTTAETMAIRRQCGNEWPRDFRMMNYCEEQQLQALRSLGGVRSQALPEPPSAGPTPTRLLVSIRPDADGWRIASQNPSHTWQDCTAYIGESSARLSALEPGGAVVVRRAEFKPIPSNASTGPLVVCIAGGTTFTATGSGR